MTEDELDELAAYAIGDCCLQLAEHGCDRGVISCTLAALLGALLATIDCCEQHQAEAKATVLEVLEEVMASNGQRWEAAANFPPCQGRA